MKNFRKIAFVAILNCALLLSGCGHQHTFDLNTWKSDATEHWHPSTCGHDVKKDEAIHIDSNGDGICDVCNYLITNPTPSKDFVGLVFNDLTIKYDGQIHSLKVENAPEIASITYINNDKKDVGTYNVTAIVSAEGYNTKVLTATLAIKANEFTGLVFKSMSIFYDGKVHPLKVENVPEFATVSYSNNENKDVGVHTVTATISAPGYNTKTLTASLEIKANDFTGLVFNGLTTDYDGKVHSLKVENVPDFATVRYSNNDKKEVGSYLVSASVSATGYNTKTLTATLKINGEDFTGLVFNDLTVGYDGQVHSLEVENVPDFATVTYKNNNKKEVGSYKVTATVSAPGYNSKTLTATLTITEDYFSRYVEFIDQTFIYTGAPHKIEMKLVNADYLAINTSYKCTNHSGIQNIATEPGTYKIELTVTSQTDSKKTQKFTATMTILDNLISTDSTKTQYTFDSSVKYNEFIENIAQSNLTVNEVFKREKLVKDTDEVIETDYSYEAVAGYTSDKYFYKYVDIDNDKKALDGYCDYSYIDGNYMLYKNGTENEYDSYPIETSKLLKSPKESFKETIFTTYGSSRGVMTLLNFIGEGIDGGLVSLSDDIKILSIENNELILEERTHHYYSEYDRDEVVVYTFGNIGNTKVDLSNSAFICSVKEISSSGFNYFTYNGISYDFDYDFYGNEYYEADISLSRMDLILVKPKTFELLPEFGGIAVGSIIFDMKAYGFDIDLDYAGYVLNTWFDYNSDTGYAVYKGKYSSLRSFDFYPNQFNGYFVRNGVINYYSEWAI